MKKLVCLIVCLGIISGVPAANALYFPDVKAGSWYYDAVQRASDGGILIGDEKGNFSPDKALTRAESAMILYRLFGKKLEYAFYAEGWQDVPFGSWYYDAVVNVGIAMGGNYSQPAQAQYDYTWFSPTAPANREDFAVALFNLMGLEQNGWKYHFNDIDSITWDNGTINNYRQAACAMANLGIMVGDNNNNFNPQKSITRAEVAKIVCNLADGGYIILR